MENKVIWKSKTLWVNLILAGVAFFPGVREHIDANAAVQIIAGVNFLLRFWTDGKLQLSDK